MVSGVTCYKVEYSFGFADSTVNEQLHNVNLETFNHYELHGKNYFELIREKNQLGHFPFISFDDVQIIKDKSTQDGQVEKIKINLYRVIVKSAITDSLLTAINSGKTLTVFLEAKARFDDEVNIKWGQIFEEYAARVICNYPKIIAHSKVLLVFSKEGYKVKKYAYMTTVNFNARATKLYGDQSIFTAHKVIIEDLSRILKILQGDLIIPRAKNLLISTFNKQPEFKTLIRSKMENVQNGKEVRVTAKLNQLENPGRIGLLYQASQFGLKIRLIVKRFTSLISGLESISGNIIMKLIVDRFLEYGSVYKFHSNGEPSMFVRSADRMSQNLDRWIKVLTHTYDDEIFKELDGILSIQMANNAKDRVHTPQEDNLFVKINENRP